MCVGEVVWERVREEWKGEGGGRGSERGRGGG